MSERKDEVIQNIENEDEGLQNIKNEDEGLQNIKNEDEVLQNVENENEGPQIPDGVQNIKNEDEGLQNIKNEDEVLQNVENEDEVLQNVENEDEVLQNVENEDEGPQIPDGVQNIKNEDEGLKNKEGVQNVKNSHNQKETSIFFGIQKRLKNGTIFCTSIFVVILCFSTARISELFDQTNKMNEMLKEKRKTNNKLSHEVHLLKQALDFHSQNLNKLKKEHSQVKLQLNSTLERVALLSAAKMQTEVLLNNTLQEKANLLHASTTLKDKNIKLLSVLSSNMLSYIWNWCQKDPLQCSRCPPGWTEHALRCFMLSQTAQKWEEARRDCLKLRGDLAVVLTAKDQAFLTNITFEFVRKNPTMDFHSAWIGLQDMVQEGTFMWVSGEKLRPNLAYWKEMEPNNAIASWDTDQLGQDCVAIVPPKNIFSTKWLHSWDDIICGGKRHYICEVPAFVWP